MPDISQNLCSASAVAPIIHLDFPPAITADRLSELIGQSIPTILANRSRARHKLPPACVAPGTKQPVWLLSDVLAWLASHRETPAPRPKRTPAPRAAMAPNSLRRRPTLVEQEEAKAAGFASVKEFRRAQAQEGGAQ